MESMEEFNTIMREIRSRLIEMKHEADFYPVCNHCGLTQCCGGIPDPHIHEEDKADICGWDELLDRLETLFRKKFKTPQKQGSPT